MNIFELFKKKETQIDDYTLKKQDEETIEFLYKSLKNKAKTAQKGYEQNREENRKFYKSQQWTSKLPSYKSQTVSNFVSLLVRDVCAILTDNRPSMSVVPVDTTQDNVVAEILTKLLQHIQYQNKIEIFNYKLAKWVAIEGICYIRPVWNNELSNGLGDIEYIIERADDVFMDPSGGRNYFSIRKEMALMDIYRLYPDKADEVKESISEKKESSSEIGRDRNKGPTLTTESSISSMQIINHDLSTQHSSVKIDIFWLKDSTVEKVAKKENGDDSVPDDVIEKYPYGRWITVANENVIVEDKPCLTKHFPIVPLILDPDPETESNGISLIDYIKSLQKDYNEMDSLIKDWLKTVAHPRGIGDKSSGIIPSKVNTKAGVILLKKQGTEFRWDQPPQLPNDIFNYVNTKKNNIEFVSGQYAASQGRMPTGITSGAAINMVQEAGKTLIRPQARFLEAAMKDLGILTIDMIQTGYSEKRIIKIFGEEVVINNPEIVDGIQRIKNDVSVGIYDVEVEPDSTLPLSRIERINMMFKLGELGWVDRQAILPQTGLKNWRDIDSRIQAKEDEKKQMDATASQSEMQIEQSKQEFELKKLEMELATKIEIEKIKLHVHTNSEIIKENNYDNATR